MTVSREQAQMLATLAVAARPHGAPAWDAPGVMAAIGKVHDRNLADVILAVTRAARDRDAKTPGVITAAGSIHWAERTTTTTAPEKLTPAERCSVCSNHHAKCRQLWGNDHIFQADFRTDPGIDVPATVAALKAEVAPAPVVASPRTLDDLLPAERNPHAEDARAAMATTEDVT